MFRKAVFTTAFFIVTASLSFALPTVAILQAVIAPGIDPTVDSPITAKTEEAFVNSGRFQVLDRVNVMQILKEKEFQLSSGLVSTGEMRQVGEYLGADFVVVANVSRVGQTFTISAKMVNVTSGQIAGQASAEKQGTIDVLLALAAEVAGKLAGIGTTIAESTPAAEQGKAPQQEQSAAKQQAQAPPLFPRSTLAVELFPPISAGWWFCGAYYFRFTEVFGASVALGLNLDAGDFEFAVGPSFTALP